MGENKNKGNKKTQNSYSVSDIQKKLNGIGISERLIEMPGVVMRIFFDQGPLENIQNIDESELDDSGGDRSFKYLLIDGSWWEFKLTNNRGATITKRSLQDKKREEKSDDSKVVNPREIITLDSNGNEIRVDRVRPDGLYDRISRKNGVVVRENGALEVSASGIITKRIIAQAIAIETDHGEWDIDVLSDKERKRMRKKMNEGFGDRVINSTRERSAARSGATAKGASEVCVPRGVNILIRTVVNNKKRYSRNSKAFTHTGIGTVINMSYLRQFNSTLGDKFEEQLISVLEKVDPEMYQSLIKAKESKDREASAAKKAKTEEIQADIASYKIQEDAKRKGIMGNKEPADD